MPFVVAVLARDQGRLLLGRAVTVLESISSIARMVSAVRSRQHALAVVLLAVSATALPAQQDNSVARETLDCNAYTGEDQAVEVSANLSPSQAPSDAPSQAPVCGDKLSNARGTYTSDHAPCTIKFHSVSNLQREGEESDLIEYRTSDLCRDETVIVEIKEYLSDFPDECVGDFERCYSLVSVAELILLLCSQEQ